MPNYTRADLVTQVSELIGDTSNQQWSTTQIQDRLQKAQEKFAEDTHCVFSTASFSVTEGNPTYTLPEDTLDVVRVQITGFSTLKKTSKFDLDLNVGGYWNSAPNNIPSHYYIKITDAAQVLLLWPSPSSVCVGTNNMNVEYCVSPTLMSSDSSAPLNGITLLNPYVDAIPFYAAAQILYASNNQADWTKANVMMSQYKNKVVDCVETFKDLMYTTPYRLRVSGIGRVVNAR